jgi:hypothetical protein
VKECGAFGRARAWGSLSGQYPASKVFHFEATEHQHCPVYWAQPVEPNSAWPPPQSATMPPGAWKPDKQLQLLHRMLVLIVASLVVLSPVGLGQQSCSAGVQSALQVAGTPLSSQGYSVSLSSDGTVLAVGGPYYNSDAGAVWVNRYDGSAWVEMPGMPLQGVASSKFGWSVSLSSNGTMLAVGAYAYSNRAGATWVYRYTGGAWATMPNMPLLGPADSNQGYSVSLSLDGTVLAIGAPGYNVDAGATYVYRYNGSAWGEMAGMPLAQAGVGIAEQGYSVSLSSDGTMLAVGAPKYDSASNTGAGATWVYRYNAGAWAVMGTVLVGPMANTDLGWSVSLSSDGTALAVGGPSYGQGLQQTLVVGKGATWVYRYSGNAWAEMAGMPLTQPDATTAEQGWSVSLSSDGTVLAVGAPYYNSETGGTWVYRYNGSLWAELQGMPLSNTSQYEQGASVSLSSDGTLLAVGGPLVPNIATATVVYALALACEPGSYLESGSLPVACTLAQPGSYAAGYTTSSTSCLPGTYSNVSGAQACPLCPGGTYGPTTGATSCLTCPPGTHHGSVGQASPASCAACPPGYYPEAVDMSTCLGCPQGTYAPSAGSASCTPCSAGFFGPSPLATSSAVCQVCGPGYYSAAGAASCSPCPAGTYSRTKAASSDQACTPCPHLERAAAGSAKCSKSGAWYALFVMLPLFAAVVLAVVALRRTLAKLRDRFCEWRERLRRDKIAGQQLEALLALHGMKDPTALQAVQVSPPHH